MSTATASIVTCDGCGQEHVVRLAKGQSSLYAARVSAKLDGWKVAHEQGGFPSGRRKAKDYCGGCVANGRAG